MPTIKKSNMKWFGVEQRKETLENGKIGDGWEMPTGKFSEKFFSESPVENY